MSKVNEGNWWGGIADDSPHYNDLEWKIQAAGQMYQSIKDMRHEHEQQHQHKKRLLLRRRMRSLEDQNSWRKLHLCMGDLSSPPILDSDMTMASSKQQQQQSSEVVTSIIKVEQPTMMMMTTSIHGKATTATPIDKNSVIQQQTVSDGSTASDSENIHFKYQQPEQQGEDLLQLCEEQQDLLERLLRHYQDQQKSWDRRHETLRVERDDLLKERRHCMTCALNEPDNKNKNDDDRAETNLDVDKEIRSEIIMERAANSTKNNDSELLQEINQLKDQIQSLQDRLVSEEELHRQQLDEKCAMTIIASSALASAMQRLRKLQELAFDLQSVCHNGDKEGV
jgi:hypothetical protein